MTPLTPLQLVVDTVEAHEVPAALPSTSDCLNRDEQCPLCSGSNQCRVAKGELYKGPCWCFSVTVPTQVLNRLGADRIQPACLCRPCLETVARISREYEDTEMILAEVKKEITGRCAVSEEREFYLDEKGNVVFTSAYHLKRGNCCENGCRHCPY